MNRNLYLSLTNVNLAYLIHRNLGFLTRSFGVSEAS
jgi:hypothetical protein